MSTSYSCCHISFLLEKAPMSNRAKRRILRRKSYETICCCCKNITWLLTSPVLFCTKNHKARSRLVLRLSGEIQQVINNETQSGEWGVVESTSCRTERHVKSVFIHRNVMDIVINWFLVF